MELVYSVNDIKTVAATLWNEIHGSEVIALEGDMGAGKTTLVQAICQHLGVKGTISSPTFSIINEYRSDRETIYHIDLYRCKDEEEVIRAGVEDCLFSGNVCFVEWPSVARNIFPANTVTLSIKQIDSNTRSIIVNRKLYGQTIHQ